MLVELVAVSFVGVGDERHDVAERVEERSELGLCELVAGNWSADFEFEGLSFAFDFGDPFDERADLGIRVAVRGNAVQLALSG